MSFQLKVIVNFTRTPLSPVVIRQLTFMVLWCLKNVGLVMSACLQFLFILQFTTPIPKRLGQYGKCKKQTNKEESSEN